MADCLRTGLSSVAATLLVGAGLTNVPPAAAQPAETFPVQLASGSSLGDGTALVIGPSGVPIPSQDYVDAVGQLYLEPNGFGDYTRQILYTPEGLYPITGIKSLPLDPSAEQGLTILNNAINQLCSDPPTCGGEHIAVFGYSQSAIISGMQMLELAALPADERPDTDHLAFVLVGNENNPNGGMLERFVGLSLPSLGMTFNGSTPDNVYPTDMYTLEYDGFADFPRYPLNVLSDLNAFLGIALVHVKYTQLTPEQVEAAIPLTNTVGDTMTNYYMIPTETLPLLAPLQLLPVIGQPLYDLLEPSLRVLVNLGYGNIEHGWDPGPPNVPTPFGLFPTNLDLTEVLAALANGAQQGVTNFASDLGSLSLPELPSLPTDSTALTDLATDPLAGLTNLVNTFTGSLATGYATLLPTADIVNAFFTSLPLYDFNLFTAGIQDVLNGDPGGLIEAVGNPIAATVGISTLAGGIELLVLAQAAAEIAGVNLLG